MMICQVWNTRKRTVLMVLLLAIAGLNLVFINACSNSDAQTAEILFSQQDVVVQFPVDLATDIGVQVGTVTGTLRGTATTHFKLSPNPAFPTDPTQLLSTGSTLFVDDTGDWLRFKVVNEVTVISAIPDFLPTDDITLGEDNDPANDLEFLLASGPFSTTYTVLEAFGKYVDDAQLSQTFAVGNTFAGRGLGATPVQSPTLSAVLITIFTN